MIAQRLHIRETDVQFGEVGIKVIEMAFVVNVFAGLCIHVVADLINFFLYRRCFSYAFEVADGFARLFLIVRYRRFVSSSALRLSR